jgi:inorganic pyrophosphatase
VVNGLPADRCNRSRAGGEGERHRNDRLIAVAQQSLLYGEVTHIRDLNPTLLMQIESFFVNYQKVRGVRFNILGREGPEQAVALLRRSIEDKAA